MNDGDSRQRFERLLRPHVSSCYKTAYRLTGSRAEAEDLFQDLLLRLYQRLDQWSHMEEPAAWIHRVLYNLHIDRYRKRARSHGINEQTLAGNDSMVARLESAEPSPAEAAERDERQQRLLAALDELNAEERLLITLHLLEGRTLDEVSRLLDVPLGTLKARLHRGKGKLKNALALQPFLENRRITG